MTYTMLRGLLLTSALAVTAVASFAHAGPCKPNNQACATSQSCCSKLCVNVSPPGKKFKGFCTTPCTPTTCSAQGATCGQIPNGCGGTLECGTCAAPNTCGGGGTANTCGCTSKTCEPGVSCGHVSNGCGATLNCGICTNPDTCGGGGVANECGCTGSCTGLCGQTIDNCGQLVTCPPCIFCLAHCVDVNADDLAPVADCTQCGQACDTICSQGGSSCDTTECPFLN